MEWGFSGIRFLEGDVWNFNKEGNLFKMLFDFLKVIFFCVIFLLRFNLKVERIK